ncbi:MAG TPA: primosomal protein N' [Clostridiales bacterium]|jgi:primosomal protein N' (replication factor Y)|nr:primosomal protein N' [Clostridiales bacterium]
MVAKVAVSSANYAIDKPYDYKVPEKLKDKVKAGVRVTVPFSRGNRRAEGVVLALAESKGDIPLKSIDKVLDESPILTESQIKLALWLRERFFCTVYDAFRAMLPAGLWFKTEYSYRLQDNLHREAALEKSRSMAFGNEIIGILSDFGGEARLQDIKNALHGAEITDSLKKLIKAGILIEIAEESRRVKDKTVGEAQLLIPAEEALVLAAQKRKRSPMQAEVLELLASIGCALTREISYFTGASPQVLRNMEKAGLISIDRREVYRRPEPAEAGKIEISELTDQQQAAFEGLKELLKSAPAAALLYGVTGSGKTAVYIRLIDEVLAAGRSALVLVPEIALTPQLVSTFTGFFGDRVAVLHSSLSMGERYDEWKRIKAGMAGVVVGTRSAVFAPLENLGLIVIDEEQEHTYKSENNPRYHARDVAKYRCVQSGALLLLSSATPSVESMHSAKTGKYSLFTLDSRYNQSALPEVIIVDMKKELRQGNGSTISSVLCAEIEKNLQNGEQTILFINRRGASNLMACPECGFVYGCPNCSVSLTYHSANKRLMCHYCGYSSPRSEECPECGGLLKYIGAGTQKVQQDIKELFPGIEVLRMDTDTVSPSASHDMLLSRFEKERIPVLVGTQMVTKGLNFENVTLVGVISADQGLYAGDYRADERTFSLITQVIGRSGRGGKAGRAVIQTFTPNNELIRLAARQDYEAFYEREIRLRRALGSPPISELFAITVSGLDEAAVLRCSTEIRSVLSSKLKGRENTRVLGPAPAGILKVNNRYRYRLIVSAQNTKELRALIADIIIKYSKDKRFRGLSIFADINPSD